MSKVFLAKESPKKLRRDDYVIEPPNFLKEIQENKNKAIKGTKITTMYHLRSILASIANRYDPDSMTPYLIAVSLYEGRLFNSDEELNAIVIEMLKQHYPGIFNKYIEYHLKNRPAKTKRVFFIENDIISNEDVIRVCLNFGMDIGDLLEIDSENIEDADVKTKKK